MPRKKNETAEVKPAEIKTEEVKPAAPTQPEVAAQPTPQPQPQPNNVLFDANGNPVFVQQRPIYQESEEEKKKKGRKIGCFVASIVTLILSFVFLGLAILFFAQFMSGSSADWESVFLFLIYMFTGIGFITFVPGVGLAIASVICSCIAVRSTVKALKIISIFTIIISIIALIASVALPFFLPSIFSATMGSGSGSSRA